MSKLYCYAGIATSVILLAFGAGAVYMGIGFLVPTLRLLVPGAAGENRSPAASPAPAAS